MVCESGLVGATVEARASRRATDTRWFPPASAVDEPSTFWTDKAYANRVPRHSRIWSQANDELTPPPKAGRVVLEHRPERLPQSFDAWRHVVDRRAGIRAVRDKLAAERLPREPGEMGNGPFHEKRAAVPDPVADGSPPRHGVKFPSQLPTAPRVDRDDHAAAPPGDWANESVGSSPTALNTWTSAKPVHANVTAALLDPLENVTPVRAAIAGRYPPGLISGGAEGRRDHGRRSRGTPTG